jgi:hypothetical protein
MNRFLTTFGFAFVALSAALPAAAQTGKIGIFDLDAIHAAPLNAQVVSSESSDGVTIEQIRYDALPGIRAFAYLTYPTGKRGSPCNYQVLNFGAQARIPDAKNGFVGFSACAPQGALPTDPNAGRLTIGGAKSTEPFTDDPTKSWVYQHVVILERGLDYLATRPEVDMKRVQVSGFSWSGFCAALMHAIDNRPCCYITWNSTGYYADDKGISGDKLSRVTRRQYEMYCPSAYAKYGTQPIFIGNSITDYFATLDGAILMYHELQCPKDFVWAPNRYHEQTARHEYAASAAFSIMYQDAGPKLASVREGTFQPVGGKLFYKYYIDSPEKPTRTEVLYSYGAPGHWIGRTWHRIPAVLQGTDGYVAEIPVYDPAVPVYAVAQIETKEFGATGNCPVIYSPRDAGITAPTATFSRMLFDFEDQSDLYIASGNPEFVAGGPEGTYAASIEPFESDGMVHLVNIEPFLWPKDVTSLNFYMKGDGLPGPISLYLVRDSDYYLVKENKASYSHITIVKPNETFAPGWHEYSIPLNKIRDLNKVDSIWFESQPGRKILLDGIQLK